MKRTGTVVLITAFSLLILLDVSFGQSLKNFSQKYNFQTIIQKNPGFIPPDEEFDILEDRNELVLCITTNGTGLAYRLHKQLQNHLQLTFTAQLFGAKEDQEIPVMNYYTGYYQRYDRADFFTMLIPIHIGLQKRLFAETIENNFRPFFLIDAGPVLGISYETKFKLMDSLKLGKGMLGGGGFVGLGTELGSLVQSGFSIAIGYRFLFFPNELSGKKDFSALEARLGWVF